MALLIEVIRSGGRRASLQFILCRRSLLTLLILSSGSSHCEQSAGTALRFRGAPDPVAIKILRLDEAM
jgi:hypothetical protein